MMGGAIWGGIAIKSFFSGESRGKITSSADIPVGMAETTAANKNICSTSQ